ncbi:MAG TPA: HAMP domain-containing histidine kinase [Leucothrix sp.]|nr:HAMP domain-containing histidine kinase [Leucothrix sp.]
MHIDAKQRIRKLFRLRTILLVVMLSILLLPLVSLFFFRFYENELVRKTENELIMQSAVFASVYRELLGQNQVDRNFKYTPINPQLDFSKHQILPRRPPAKKPRIARNISAQRAGRMMQGILQNTQQFTLAGMRILDAQGVVVAGRGEVNMSLAHVQEIKNALKGEYTSVLRERISDEPPPSIASISRGTGVRVFTAFPIVNTGNTGKNRNKVLGVVYLSRTPQNILKHLYSIKEKVFLILLLLFTLTGLVVLFISSRLSRPIRELIEQTQKLTRGEIDTVEVIKQPGTYELSKLSNSFAEMSQALNERSQYIHQFASHVSHEFKTPLTSMQGSLELLLEHNDDMPEAQRLRFLNNLQEDTERLKSLVNRLLEQARADTLKGSTESTALLPVLQELRSRYIDDKLQIKINTQKNYILKVSSVSLHSVLSNLFDNSLQHGATHIDITLKETEKHLQIFIRDNGSGISEANQKNIFTPFFTTRRETGGTGLGLGIIESILNASNGSIENKEIEKGALFIISFPLN